MLDEFFLASFQPFLKFLRSILMGHYFRALKYSGRYFLNFALWVLVRKVLLCEFYSLFNMSSLNSFDIKLWLLDSTHLYCSLEYIFSKLCFYVKCNSFPHYVQARDLFVHEISTHGWFETYLWRIIFHPNQPQSTWFLKNNLSF